MSITKRSARQKGKRLEYDVRDGLVKIGILARRTPMSGALSYMKGDVFETGTDPIHVHECKNQQALSINSWWKQTIEQCINENELPVLHFTSNYKPTYTMITAQLFDELLFDYEQTHKELSINVIDLPRKNFWTVSQGAGMFDVFCTDERVILMFDTYLLFRKAQLRLQAAAEATK